MAFTLDQLQQWMNVHEEDAHIEFKEAKNRYDFDELVRYCAALANEGGGRMILGVSDKRPRKVVGSRAFPHLQRTVARVIERLHLHIAAEEMDHPDGPVTVFSVPPRPLGVPMRDKGAYWMRAGGDLAPMAPDMLKKIFDESVPDYSAEICPKASLSDLDPSAIERFREMWARKSMNEALKNSSHEQLLADAELIVEGKVTYAALVLLGTNHALGKHLAQTEVVFEYRNSVASVPFQQRQEYRQGFFLFQDALWSQINLRNEVQTFQDGLFVWNIPTFNEAVAREAILNAISHRSYQMPGSVFVRQYPRKLEIVSPGGFPPGVTQENILYRQVPRNRRIAEVFAKCGLVERSGQGFNRIFEECIKESKSVPDFAGTDDYQVSVTFVGEIQDRRFLRFLEKVGAETLSSFATQDFLVLDAVHRAQRVAGELGSRLPALVKQGVVERVGRGKGAHYILSQRFYGFLGEKGVYTRERGLDKETNKALLLKHIEGNRAAGSQLRELKQVLPSKGYGHVQKLLQELKSEGKARCVGRTKGARWYPSATMNGIVPDNRNRH